MTKVRYFLANGSGRALVSEMEWNAENAAFPSCSHRDVVHSHTDTVKRVVTLTKWVDRTNRFVKYMNRPVSEVVERLA